ncbi:MAG: hypothetical protein SF123_01505 [Chloroflexota bacterium]|nr:hypothetical protein [Chloroflexota bacterium]
MPNKKSKAVPTVITLTLPESDSDSRDGTLLIQRGDLAHLNRFTYSRIADLTEIIAEALIALSAVEADPPIIPDVPPTPIVSTKKPALPPPPVEPTVDIPLKKGKKAVKISHLKLTGGEMDAAAYRQAVQLAAILIDGKLWDGDTPIRIDDVYALAKKMKHLTARDMPLFSLTDFVQVGAVEPEPVTNETDEMPVVDDEHDEPLTLTPPHELTHSANGHHRAKGASAQTALL